MKAYKVFNPDLTCNGFQYEVGKTYTHNGPIKLCSCGFHACKKAANCFVYYEFNPKNKVAEVDLLGNVLGIDGDKQVTNKIKIVRLLSWTEVLELVNSGDRNSGYRNSGYRNSGYRNSGDGNSGYRNSGDRNSGGWNSGEGNSGYWNSGDGNSGDGNSGGWNSGDGHTGFFNSKNPDKHYIFDKLISSKELIFLKNSTGFSVCKKFSLVKYRVKTKTGKAGDWRFMSYKASWKYFWNTLSINDKKAVMDMPFFDAEVFFEITGVNTRIKK